MLFNFFFLQFTQTVSPEIEVDRAFIHTGVGYEAQLTCLVHSEPPANVIWYKDTTQLGTTEQHSQQVFMRTEKDLCYVFLYLFVLENDFKTRNIVFAFCSTITSVPSLFLIFLPFFAFIFCVPEWFMLHTYLFMLLWLFMVFDRCLQPQQ